MNSKPTKVNNRIMTELSDFGAGVDRDDPNPEDEVKIELSTWFNDDVTVYWDQSRSYGHGTFSVTKRQRPDLVVSGPSKTYAIEVKVADESANVYDGLVQTVNYWEDVVTDSVTYTSKSAGETLEIDAVLLATEFSPFGHLFHDSWNKDVKRSSRSEQASFAAEQGWLPGIEYASSETAVRAIHRFSKHRHDDVDVGIGALLSSALDGDEPGIDSSHPMTLYFIHGSKHAQNWDGVPWYIAEQ